MKKVKWIEVKYAFKSKDNMPNIEANEMPDVKNSVTFISLA